MATITKVPRRRSTRSTRISQKTRLAHSEGQALLERVQKDPTLRPLREDPEGSKLMEQLHHDLSILAVAPVLRIGAARRLQGVSSRRRTTSQSLFDACADIRRRIKDRYRGLRHAPLRRAFGEGLAASPAKPETVLLFAEQVLKSADGHTEELREVRVGPPTLQRVTNLLKSLRGHAPERAELRTARRQVADNLVEIAARVQDLCLRLSALAQRLCLIQDPLLAPKPPRRRRESAEAQ